MREFTKEVCQCRGANPGLFLALALAFALAALPATAQDKTRTDSAGGSESRKSSSIGAQEKSRTDSAGAAKSREASSVVAQDRTRTASVGGAGGDAFSFDCPPNTYLTGLRARHGAFIDAVAAECSGFNTVTQAFDAAKSSRNFGGSGGGEGVMRCAPPQGVVVELEMIPADNPYRSVGHIIVGCGDLFNPKKTANKAPGSAPFLGHASRQQRSTVSCPPDHVAAGIHGKHGLYVDRLGLQCAKKPLTLGKPKKAAK